MTDVEELAQTLLMEGYALYPYTPGASKNSTPTPFGIVYPPVYAVESPTTYDHLRLQVIAEVKDVATATLAIDVLFLEPSRRVRLRGRLRNPLRPNRPPGRRLPLIRSTWMGRMSRSRSMTVPMRL